MYADVKLVLVDWWGLGVCLYEFMIGIPPFMDETPEKVFDNILSRKMEWPEDDEALSDPSVQAITSLLTLNPSERPGNFCLLFIILEHGTFNIYFFQDFLVYKHCHFLKVSIGSIFLKRQHRLFHNQMTKLTLDILIQG